MRSRAKRSFQPPILVIGGRTRWLNYGASGLIHDFGYSHLEWNLLRCCKLHFDSPFSGGCGRNDSMLQNGGLNMRQSTLAYAQPFIRLVFGIGKTVCILTEESMRLTMGCMGLTRFAVQRESNGAYICVSRL